MLTVHLLNGKDGHALPKQQVTVLYWDAGDAKPEKYDGELHVETDANGVARFTLQNALPETVKVKVELNLQGWIWGDAAPPLIATRELSKKGIIEGSQLLASKVSVHAEPWEIVVVARPTTLWERFMAHLRGG